MRNVAVCIVGGNHNAALTCRAFAHGIEQSGDRATIRSERELSMKGFDVLVLWGFITPCQQIIKNAEAQKSPWVFMDMGYWRREHSYYKVAVNARHGTDYFMRTPRTGERWDKLGIKLKPKRLNVQGHGVVLVPGMSAKAAWSFGLKNEQYERQIIPQIKKLTSRPIVYRPKPSWSGAQSIVGSVLDKHTPLDAALANAHCVVGHHSNVGADAIVAGVPVMMKYGIGSVMGVNNLAAIEEPWFPADSTREQWAANAAYCQWTVNEMHSGACWQFLKKDGLV